MKILHLLFSTEIGGTEKAVLNYLRENRDKNIKNFAVSFKGGELDRSYKDVIPTYRSTNTTSFIRNFVELNRFVKKNKIDIIYAYGFRTSFVSRFVAKLNGKFNIYGVRGYQLNHQLLVKVLNFFTLPFVNIIVTNSYAGQNYLINNLKYKKNKVTTIHNGTYLPKLNITLNINKRKQNEVFQIICVANLKAVKGYIYLLKAIRDLLKSNKEIKLNILGEGPLREDIEEFIRKNNMEKNVQLLGSVENVYPFLMKSDLLVLPSLSEGLSNAIMEGMACGLPIVCTNVGGNIELVKDKVNGLVVDSKSNEQLKNAIEYLYDNPRELRKFGVKSREIIEENFSFERLVQKNNELFKKILKN